MKLLRCLLAASVVCLGATLVLAQESEEETGALKGKAELEATLQLVVMINAQIGGAPVFGSGIVFGRETNRLYVITANHVVRRGNAEATNIRVNLRSRAATPMAAHLLPQTDSALDLAVLAIDNITTQGADVCALTMDRLGDPGSLERGDDVYPVGNPNGVAWGMPVTPGQVSGVADSNIAFQSAFIAVGLSGGALLDADSQLVGVVLRDEPPLGTAISIDKVLEVIGRWKLPQQLRQPPDNEWQSTPLHEAVWNGDVQKVKVLLGQICPDVAAVDKQGQTPLDYAAGKGNVEILHLLLEAGAKLNRPKGQETPLYLAAQNGKIDAARLLADAGANLNAMDDSGRTPLLMAISNKNFEVAELLLKKGADPNAGSYALPLNLAAETGDPQLLRSLIAAGARVNPPSAEGPSALEIATQNERLDAVAVLLSAGADARRGFPLGIAAQKGWVPGMRLLLGAGARSTDADAEGNTALIYAVQRADAVEAEVAMYPDPRLMLSEGKRKNAFCMAYHTYDRYPATRDDQENAQMRAVFKVLLAHSNEPVNLLSDKECGIFLHALDDSDGALLALLLPPGVWDVPGKMGALIDSIPHGGSKLGVVKAMISARVDLNATDSTGHTTLHEILGRYPDDESAEAVRLLVAAGARANTRSSDPEWSTPLHVAIAQHWPEETLKLVLAAGGDPNAKDYQGRTPISLATDDYQRSELSSRASAR